jgi:transposase-like protein
LPGLVGQGCKTRSTHILGHGLVLERGILDGTLGNWVAAYKREHAGEEPQLSLDERARLREAERELREVKMENEFLKKCASYFAQRQP